MLVFLAHALQRSGEFPIRRAYFLLQPLIKLHLFFLIFIAMVTEGFFISVRKYYK
jgi:hypothetical protein